jgi:AcrR family transcriptional regulator
VIGLAWQQPVPRISVAALADRAEVTRATIDNHYDTPLDVLIGVLTADLDRGRQREEQWRSVGRYRAVELLRLTTAQVVDLYRSRTGFGYAACSYSLINPCSTSVRRTRTKLRSVTGAGSVAWSGGRCPRP